MNPIALFVAGLDYFSKWSGGKKSDWYPWHL